MIQPLSFIQENQDEDYQFSVILPAPLPMGKSFTFTTRYAGRDAIISQGWGAFYLIARTGWYPNSFLSGNYATYDMTLRYPKGLTLVATGSRAVENTEGDFDLSHWHSDVPITEASFSLGKFKKNDVNLLDQEVIIDTYANLDLTSGVSNKMRRILGEGQLALPVYTDFFGTLPYKRLALTEQSSSPYYAGFVPGMGSAYPDKLIRHADRSLYSHPGDGASDQPSFLGESLATLIFLPYISYMDQGQRFFRDIHDKSYFHALDPYLIAKQWWGNAVGQISYRDRWMFDGLAEFSASLFLQAYYKDGSYDRFWDEEQFLLIEKDKNGLRPIDEGPITLGSRIGTRQGIRLTVPTRQIGPKGAYILNMIRMMMWNNDTKDADFKKLMHDFVEFYMNRPATTEDFKLVVEQHMNPTMNLVGNGKMNWFFDEYVYGTALPNEKFSYSFSNALDGTPILNFKVAQSHVDSDFRMIIPVYIELPDGGVLRVDIVPVTGNNTVEKQITLSGVKTRPKRATINYFHDVLCTQN
jgi:hypothetical protein